MPILPLSRVARNLILLAALGAGLSLALFLAVQRLESEEVAKDFRELAGQRIDQTIGAAIVTTSVVELMADHFTTLPPDALSLDGFEQFSRPVLARHPLLTLLAWTPKVATRSEPGAAADQDPGIFFTFPIGYIHPAGAPLYSQDLAPHAPMAAALKRAVETGQTTLLPGDDPATMLLAAPVYSRDAAPGASRLEALRGFMIGGVSIPALLNGSGVGNLPPAGEALVRLSLADPAALPASARHTGRSGSANEVVREVVFGQQTRLLTASATSHFFETHRPRAPRLVLVAALLGVVALLATYHAGCRRAQKLTRRIGQARSAGDNLAEALAIAGIAIVDVDLDAGTCALGQGSNTLLGIEADVTTLPLRGAFAAVNDESYLLLSQALAGPVGQIRTITLTTVAAGSEQRIIQAAIAKRKADRRQCLVALQDITQQSLTKQALAQSESRLRMALEATKLGTWRHWIDDKIFEFDTQAALIYRYDSLRMTEAQLLDRVHPDDRSALVAMMDHCNHRAAPGQPMEGEFRLRHANGDITYLKISAQTRFEGEGDGRTAAFAIGTVRDVTDQKLVEAGFQEINEMHRLIVAESSLAIAVFADDGTTILCNDAYIRLIGAPRQQAMAQGFRDLKSWPNSTILSMAADTLATGNPGNLTEHLTTSFGREIWVDVSMARITRDGRPHLLFIGNDVTKRALTEKAMARQANRLQALLKTASDGLHVMAENGDLVQASDSFYRMLGYDPADPPRLNVRDWDVQFTESQLTVEMKNLFSARQPVFFPTRHRRADGSIIDVEISAQGLMFDDKHLLYASSRDVTRRVGAERDRNAAEAKFRGLVEQSMAGIYIIQGDGFAYVNPQFAGMFGFDDPAEIVGKVKVADLIAPDERDTVARNIRDRLSGKVDQVRYSFVGRRRDGSDVVVDVHGRALSHNGEPAIIGLVVDITEQRRGETAMRDLLTKQKAILSGIPIGIAVTSLDRTLLEANDTFLRVFGASNDIVGKPIQPAYVDDGIFDHIGDQAYPLIVTGGIYREDLHVRRRDGTDVWSRVLGALIDPQDPDQGIIWVLEDISDRKHLELELKRSNSDLEQFAYVASHDLRQPLRAVTSYVGLIRRALEKDLSDDLKEYMGFVVNGARRMDQLIVDLLDYSRTGRGTTQPQAVPLAGIIEECRLNLAIAIDETAATIDVPAPLPVIMGYASELTRLFQNLIGNAIKYHAPDRSPHVTITCHGEADEIVVTVQDNGIGIAAKDHDRVFAVFQRLVPNDAYEGTGIGLAIVKKVVTHHRGRIWIESVVGTGTSFHIAFPAGIVVSSAGPPPDSPEPAPPGDAARQIGGARQNLPGAGQNLPPN